MLEAGLIVSRFAHYMAVCAVFGIALFPFYNPSGGAAESAAPLIRWQRQALVWGACAALVTCLAWLAFTTANMSDDMSAAVDPAALEAVAHSTKFGHLWMVRLTLGLAMVVVAAFGLVKTVPSSRGVGVLMLSAALLATLAGTGHAQENEGLSAVVHVVADAAHLLAAGAWLGGLIVLAFLLRTPLPEADVALQRFSGMGSIAVAVLVASGLANAWFLVGSWSHLANTTYGQLLLLKISLFVGMLCLAAANRFWLVPSLARKRPQSLIRLRRHVLWEQILGALVLVIVSVIGTIEPAIAQS